MIGAPSCWNHWSITWLSLNPNFNCSFLCSTCWRFACNLRCLFWLLNIPQFVSRVSWLQSTSNETVDHLYTIFLNNLQNSIHPSQSPICGNNTQQWAVMLLRLPQHTSYHINLFLQLHVFDLKCNLSSKGAITSEIIIQSLESRQERLTSK